MCIIFLLVQQITVVWNGRIIHMILWQGANLPEDARLLYLCRYFSAFFTKKQACFEYFCKVQLARAAYLVKYVLLNTRYCGTITAW